MQDWHVWLVAALLLVVSEMFAGDFWLTCIAIGSLAATLVGLSPLGLTAQVLVFAAVTLVSMGVIRPALLRRFRVGHDVIRTNMDALLGKVGVVTERIGPGGTGRAKVEGEDWRCAGMDDAVLEPGTRVMVVQVDGSTLLVERES